MAGFLEKFAFKTNKSTKAVEIRESVVHSQNKNKASGLKTHARF